MDNLQDIIIKTNTFYDATTKTFKEEISSGSEVEIVEEPVIVMNTLHSCYSHAILDCCFPIYWVIDELVKTGRIPDRDIHIFIRKEDVLNYPVQNLPLINSVAKTYNGVFRNIIELLTPHPIMFEHTIDKNYIFKTCIFFPIAGDRWQRTPWNCVEYYPGRNVPRHEIRFPDTLIYEKLLQFRNSVFVKTGVDMNSHPTNNLVIIDRKYNRKIESTKLQQLIEETKKNTNWNFTGVVCLEHCTFEEQVKLFASNHIFIMRHGSSEINLLWIPNNSIVFELAGGPEGIYAPTMYKRICKLTNSKHIVLNYNSFNCHKDIIDKITDIST
jgi:hypothetical protein